MLKCFGNRDIGIFQRNILTNQGNLSLMREMLNLVLKLSPISHIGWRNIEAKVVNNNLIHLLGL